MSFSWDFAGFMHILVFWKAEIFRMFKSQVHLCYLCSLVGETQPVATWSPCLHTLGILRGGPEPQLCKQPVSFFGSFPCAWTGGSTWVPEGIPRCHHWAAGAGSGHPACNCRARGSCRLELCLEETVHRWAALEKQVSWWHVHGLKCHFVSHLQVWYSGIPEGSAVVRTLAEIRHHAFKLLRLVFTYSQEQASSSLLVAAWL